MIQVKLTTGALIAAVAIGSTAMPSPAYAAKETDDGVAKITHQRATPAMTIKTLEDYDAQLANYRESSGKSDEELAQDEGYLHILWQRHVVDKATYTTLADRMSRDEDFTAAVSWLLSDYEALGYFMEGGEPEANAGRETTKKPTPDTYMSALTVLSKIYQQHASDVSGDSVPENASLYKRIMIATALTHSVQNLSWFDRHQAATFGYHLRTESEPVGRYEVVKRLYDKGMLVDIFDQLNMEELRMVVAAQIGNEQFQWANQFYHVNKWGNTDYETDPIAFDINKPGAYGLMFPYSTSDRYPNSTNMRPYFSSENFDTWNAKYGLSIHNSVYDYDVPYGFNEQNQALLPMWALMERGGVCVDIGASSMVGFCSLGIPSIYAYQPGHCVYMKYGKDAQGRVTWNVGYNVFGLPRTGSKYLGQTHLPAGWGDYDWASFYNIGYLHAGLGAMYNLDGTDFDKAQALSEMGRVALDGGDAEEAIALYNKALEAQYYNLTAWDGLAKAYEAAGKTDADYYELAQRAAEELKFQPTPMYDYLTTCLYNRVKSLTVRADLLALTNTYLDDAIATFNQSPFEQPGNIKTWANYLKETITRMASFSFDTGEFTLDGSFVDAGAAVEYSFDGGATWTSWMPGEGELSYAFTAEELARITDENDILYRFAGAKAAAHRIVIGTGATPVSNVSTNTVNDNEDVFQNIQEGLEYSTDAGVTWHDLTAESTFEGDVTVWLRRKATGTTLPSAHIEVQFTKSDGSADRVYIPTKSVKLVSGPANFSNNVAANAFDGKENTQWINPYSNQNASMMQDESGNWVARHVWEFVVELDEARYLTVMTYLPGDDVLEASSKTMRNSAIRACEIYVSADNKSWQLAAIVDDWAADTALKSVEFERPTYGKYIKIKTKNVGTIAHPMLPQFSLGLASAKEFTFYENRAVKSKQVKSIAMMTDLAKATYKVGDKLDIANMAAQLTYTDGTTSLVPASELTFNVDVLDRVGEVQVTASYGGASADFAVQVTENDRIATSIKAVTAADRIYYAGDELDSKHVSVEVSDGSESWYLLPGDFSIEGVLAAGESQLTVVHGDLRQAFTVTAEKQPTGLTADTQNAAMQYSIGDNFNAEGLVLTATFADGEQRALEEDAYELGLLEGDEVKPIREFSKTSGSKTVRAWLKDRPDSYVDIPGITVLPYITSGAFTFEAADGATTCAVTGFTPEAGYASQTVEVPSSVEVNGVIYTVTSIADGAFSGAPELSSVSLPSSVAVIKSGAFASCPNLKNVYLLEHKSFDDFTCEENAFADVEDGYVYLRDELQGTNSPIPGYQVAGAFQNAQSVELVAPSKLSYALGEELDTTGLRVFAVLADGSKRETGQYELSGYNKDATGSQKVTVTLTGTTVSGSFDVEVGWPKVSIDAHPQDAAYAEGEAMKPLHVRASTGKTAPHFQWYKASSAGGDGTAIAGATGASYTPEGAGFYYAEVYLRDANGKESDRTRTDAAEIMVGAYVASVGGKGYANLTEAFAAAQEGDEVALLADAEVSAGAALTDVKAVTLDGRGHTLKRASSYKGAFVVLSGAAEFSMRNVVFDGGAVWEGESDATLMRGTKNAGAQATSPLITVANTSALTLNDGAVLRNNANKSNGGAISTAGGSPAITIDGGAIQNCWTGNLASAVYVGGSGKLVVRSGLVEGNSATHRGAFCIDGNATTLDISGGTFRNNRGNSTGGVVWAGGKSVTVSGGTFEHNYAVELGGALIVGVGNQNAATSISGGTFIDNASGGDGGAVMVYNNAIRGLPALRNATFRDNKAAGKGGAVCVSRDDSRASLTVSDVIFEGNEAAEGGAVYSVPPALSLYNVTAVGNTAERGGAFWTNGSLTLANASFANNNAAEGAAAYQASGKGVIITGYTAMQELYLKDFSTAAPVEMRFNPGDAPLPIRTNVEVDTDAVLVKLSGGARPTAVTWNGQLLERTNDAAVGECLKLPGAGVYDISQFRNGGAYTAPTKKGYVFAGWYTTSDPALQGPETAAPADAKEGRYFAKFVNENVLTTKFQVKAGTNANSDKTDLRMLTSVDTLLYKEVGFKVVRNGGEEETKPTTTVYTQITSNDGKAVLTKDAWKVFAPESNYFAAYAYRNIPKAAYGTTMTVTPYWVTFDGTEVRGATRTVTIAEVLNLSSGASGGNPVSLDEE